MGGIEGKEVVIIGARNLCRTLLGFMAKSTQWRPIAIIDDGVDETELFGLPIFHPDNYKYECRDAILAVGYPSGKIEVMERLEDLNLCYHSYIDQNAEISPYASIGNGCIIGPYVLVAGDARIGDFVYMSPYSSAGHSTTVGHYSSLMTHSAVGGSTIGERCTVGGYSLVINGGCVESDATVAPHSLVRDRVPSGALAKGSPARIFKNMSLT